MGPVTLSEVLSEFHAIDVTAWPFALEDSFGLTLRRFKYRRSGARSGVSEAFSVTIKWAPDGSRNAPEILDPAGIDLERSTEVRFACGSNLCTVLLANTSTMYLLAAARCKMGAGG
jgi:hypothetical protein